MFKKLFNLFNGGKKCEERTSPDFKYEDRVRIKEGFYEGQKGVICDKYGKDRFLVITPSNLIWVDSSELEKV